MLFAWYFSDPNILISSYITDDSRIMFRRNIKERVRDDRAVPAPRPQPLPRDQRWTPFLDAGRVYDERLLPLCDRCRAVRGADSITSATRSRSSSTPTMARSTFTSSIRSDPIAATYQRIFPGLFKPLAAMPQDLQRHIRYPEDLFLIQAQIYRAYHMDDPEVFYNREDLWQFPRQAADGPTAMMAPYYMIMRLPGEQQAENILMLPMVPSQRENMIAWLAARCDPPHYGELIVYEFPKGQARLRTVPDRGSHQSEHRRYRSNSPSGTSWARGSSAGTFM